MNRFSNIVVPTDFSPHARHAFKYARAFAEGFGGKLHFVHVIDDRSLDVSFGVSAGYARLDETKNDLKSRAAKQLAHLRQNADALGLTSDSHLRFGTPVDEILKVTDEVNGDLITMATHGHSGFEHMILGSTCEKVLRGSSVPVFAVKHPEHEFVQDDDTAIHLNRILCPCDFSDFSHQAIPRAAELCQEFDAKLVLAHVVETWPNYSEFGPAVALNNSLELRRQSREQLDKLAAEQIGIDVEVRIAEGSPHRTLAELISTENIDLVVMATHGRSGIKHVLMGSVTERLLRKARCPVMTIRPQSKDSDDAQQKTAKETAPPTRIPGPWPARDTGGPEELNRSARAQRSEPSLR